MADTGRILSQSAEREARLIDQMTATFARELTQVVRLLNVELRRLVRELATTPKKRLVANRQNLARVVRLKADLVAAVRAAGYGAVMAKAVDEPLDLLAASVIRGDRLAQGAATLTAVDVDALVALKELKLAQLLGLEDDVATTLWRVTVDGVLGARDIEGLVDDLADALEVSSRQARVVYDTAVSTYSRQASLLLAEGTPEERFVYVGPVDSKMREFCAARVGRVYTRAAIEQMDNGIKGFSNVLLTGGGPNCRHQWRRVPAFDAATNALVGTPGRVDYVQEQLDDLAEAA